MNLRHVWVRLKIKGDSELLVVNVAAGIKLRHMRSGPFCSLATNQQLLYS